MAHFRLHTSPLSYNSLRPELVIAEKGVTDYETVPVDIITGSHKTADFLKKNPFGQIPLLECDGFAISESRAVARFLAVKYDDIEPFLVPDYRSNAKAYALFEEAIAIESMKFDPYASSLIYHKLIAPALSRPSDQAVITRSQERLRNNLKVINDILATRKYMAGDSYSVVDINYMADVHMLFKCGEAELITAQDNLSRWWTNVTSREAWKKVVAQLDEAYDQVVKQLGGEEK